MERTVLDLIGEESARRALRAALSRGGSYADIFIEERRSTVIHLEDNRIEKAVSGTVSGVGLRLLFDGKTAYAYGNDFSEAALMSLAGAVSSAVRENGSERDLDLRRRLAASVSPIAEPPDGVPMEARIALVRAGNERARSFGERVRQVLAVYRDSRQRVAVVSSEGFIAEDDRTYTTGMVQVVAAKNGVIQTGYETAGGLVGFELFGKTTFVDLAGRAAERALGMLDARRAPGGRMPVVIASEAGGTMIHEAIGHGLEADLARRGLSVYTGKLGQPVASPLVTVIDDATLPNRRGSFSFDDEGTPSHRTVLVDGGTLKTYLYDRATAAADGCQSTGNGRRESFENKPIPRMTNTFIAPGTSDPGSIVSSVARGLLVKRMGGGQVNTVTGDFVFDVQEGYLIQGGRVGDLVRGATLVGNGPGVLRSIDMVGSDLGFSIGTCGKDSQGVPVSDAMPTVRIREIVVGGEVVA